MQATYSLLKCFTLLALTVLCVILCCVTLSISRQVISTIYKIDGEIDELHRLTLEAGLTAMEARKASAKESQYLDRWNAQIAQTMTEVHTVMENTAVTVLAIRETAQGATGTLGMATETIRDLQNPIAQATLTLQAVQSTTQGVDAIVRDPQITDTIAHTDATMGHLDGTAADVQAEVHSLTHPTWAHKLFTWTLQVVHAVNPL